MRSFLANSIRARRLGLQHAGYKPAANSSASVIATSPCKPGGVHISNGTVTQKSHNCSHGKAIVMESRGPVEAGAAYACGRTRGHNETSRNDATGGSRPEDRPRRS